jgi:hypothetical protein
VVSRTLTGERVVALLGETPQRIAELTARLSAEQLRAAPGPGEWSATDVLAHLRACADVWGQCVATIITEDQATLRAVNPLTWIERTDYRDLGFRPSFRSYFAQRADLLQLLEPLSPEGWLRTATVTGAGRALTRTVLFYGQWLAGHERTHVKQFAQIVKAVGA